MLLLLRVKWIVILIINSYNSSNSNSRISNSSYSCSCKAICVKLWRKLSLLLMRNMWMLKGCLKGGDHQRNSRRRIDCNFKMPYWKTSRRKNNKKQYKPNKILKIISRILLPFNLKIIIKTVILLQIKILVKKIEWKQRKYIKIYWKGDNKNKIINNKINNNNNRYVLLILGNSIIKIAREAIKRSIRWIIFILVRKYRLIALCNRTNL